MKMFSVLVAILLLAPLANACPCGCVADSACVCADACSYEFVTADDMPVIDPVRKTVKLPPGWAIEQPPAPMPTGPTVAAPTHQWVRIGRLFKKWVLVPIAGSATTTVQTTVTTGACATGSCGVGGCANGSCGAPGGLFRRR